MTNAEVAIRFLHKEAGNSTTMKSDGEKLYSYNTCIAQYHNDKIVGNATKYSSTSSRHLSYVRNHVDVWTTEYVPINTHNLLNFI